MISSTPRISNTVSFSESFKSSPSTRYCSFGSITAKTLGTETNAVSIVPNKGAYVTGITEKDMRDIYTARSLLEGRCTRWAAEHMTAEQIEKLEENLELSEFYVQRENYRQVCELDTQFHEILYAASESRIFYQMLSDFHHYVERVRRISLATKGRAEESNREHWRILEAIKAKEERLAEELATEHVLNTLRNMDSYGIENLLKASAP